MNCEKYEHYQKGKISQSVFDIHIKSCTYCQHEINSDKQLLAMAVSLDNHVSTPNLWPQIKDRIELNQSRIRLSRFPNQLIKIAAAIFIGISTIVFFNYKPDPNKESILSSSALLEVEQKESEYVRAISHLENVALDRMDNFDINLALLYRDKLETIDSQIERCKDALKTNPANTHIRRYLLAALNDKKETLREILRSY